jgi:hypothetical protein
MRASRKIDGLVFKEAQAIQSSRVGGDASLSIGEVIEWFPAVISFRYGSCGAGNNAGCNSARVVDSARIAHVYTHDVRSGSVYGRSCQGQVKQPSRLVEGEQADSRDAGFLVHGYVDGR